MAPVIRWDVRLLDRTDSTNRVAADLAREGAPEGVVVVADHQLAGRGRLGRTWVAPAGSSLLVSVLLRPALALERVGLVTVAAGVAAASACQRLAGVRPGLKWPNDLVVGERKLAGILAESVIEGGRPSAVVVGMGLNLRAVEGLPATAVSLEEASGTVVGRDELLEAWLEEYGRRLEDLDGALDAWRAVSATLGRRVRAELGSGDVEGVAVDVDVAGRLLLDTDDGRRLVLAAGDVVHLRPAP